MSQDYSLQVLTKCRITMHKNQFMLLLNDMKRKFLACFYPLELLCNTSFFSMINWISSFLILFFLLRINVIYLGYFSKIKDIMNVNIFFLLRKICYDQIDDYGQLCAFLPNYWPWSLWWVLFTWVYIIWQAFRLSGTTFVRNVCIKFEYLQACLLWTQSACGSHIHSSDKTWKKGT